MESFIVKPLLGLKMDVPQNDATLFQADGDKSAVVHCVDMDNVDMSRLRRSASKSTGITQYSTAVNSTAVTCQGLFELKGSSITDHLYFDEGKVYVLSSDLSFSQVDSVVSDGVTFGTGEADLFSVIQVGDYAVFTDASKTLTPYKWKNADANISKLIATGTEYTFKYLETFQRRIIGAYSNQTNGDIEVRWTQDWTTADFFASACTFAATNQLYKSGNDSITGIKRFVANACFLYGDNSISTIDYFGNYSMPFGLRTLINNHGGFHHSIVDVGTAHFFFNKDYGFVFYDGGSEFPSGGKPISDNIIDIVSSINPAYYESIVGKFIPQKNEICWATPINGSSTPNALLFYNINTGQWWKKTVNSRYIDFWTLSSSLLWSGLAGLGYTTWENFGMLKWSDIVSSSPYMAHGNTDGHIYIHTGESNAGADWDGYRVEPIISLGGIRRSLLLEIWFGLSATGNFNLHVYYRGGDSVNECERSSWTELDDVSMNSPDNAVCYTAQNNRYHQLKWGTNSKNESFSINSIEYKFVPQGEY